MRVSHQPYPDQFKSDALDLLRRGDRSLKQVAEALGVNHWTLRDWYRKDLMSKRAKKSPASTITRPADETPEQQLKRLERENTQLKRENDQLRMDREILKKAAAFFAKESE